MVERTNVAIQQRAPEEEPDRSTVAIRHDIAAKRESISETVDKLGDRLQKTLDWREYVAEYPAVALGLAAGAGFLVAGIFKRNPTPRERIMDAFAELTEDMTDRMGGVVAGVIQKKVVSSRTMKAAATAAIAKALVDIAKKQISRTMINANTRLETTAHGSVLRSPDTNVQTAPLREWR
ncbi:MAG TPA: hypothetical protein VLG74_16810 [Blastocatellia bacterium]|nr:hypothetical protein [Blastocatellia bacterium]